MGRAKQLSFNHVSFSKPKDAFGGDLLKNSHAKTARPLDSKLPIHLVLRARRGGLRTWKTMLKVDALVHEQCRKHGVKLYEYANVGNHLHLVLKLSHRRAWAAFIRELTGRISQMVQGITAQEKGQKFWKQRPFTRIVAGWKKAFRIAKGYVELNRWEADGHIDRTQIKKLKDLRLIFADG